MKNKWILAIAAAIVLVAIGGVVTWSQQGPGVELNPVHELPDTVADVNGRPVSGQLVAILEANGMSHSQALQVAIDEELLLQAAERLGLSASRDEAVQALQIVEESWANLPDEKLQEVQAVLLEQGLPTSNLSEDSQLVELYGRRAALKTKLRGFLLERLAVSEITGIPVDDMEDLEDLEAAKDSQVDDEELQRVKGRLFNRLKDEVERFTEQERDRPETDIQVLIDQ